VDDVVNDQVLPARQPDPATFDRHGASAPRKGFGRQRPLVEMPDGLLVDLDRRRPCDMDKGRMMMMVLVLTTIRNAIADADQGIGRLRRTVLRHQEIDVADDALTRVVKQIHQQISDPLQPDRLDAPGVQNVQNGAYLTPDPPIEIQSPLEIAPELLVSLPEEVRPPDSQGKGRRNELFAGEHEKLRPVQPDGGKPAPQPDTRPSTALRGKQSTAQCKSLQVIHEQALREVRDPDNG
jgi:hypothetical protein